MSYDKIKIYFALCDRFFQDCEITECELLMLSLCINLILNNVKII